MLAVTTTVGAAPNADSSSSVMERVIDWLAGLGDRFGLELTCLRSGDAAAPDLDPNGTDAVPPVLLLDPDGSHAVTGDDGEGAPDLDPDG
jgi:hypothetical protein